MNELKPEDVMKENDFLVRGISKEQLAEERVQALREGYHAILRKNDALIAKLEAYIDTLNDDKANLVEQINEKDAEIERLNKERDDARWDCAVAEQNHYECKKELEEMSDDILDSVRAERDRYKAERQQYQSAFLKATMDAEQERFQCKNICEPTYKNLLETARAEAITEFEKKLMEKKCHYTETEHTFDFDGVTVEDIEQTAKELKGEPDEN